MQKIKQSFDDFQRRTRALLSANQEGVRGPGVVKGIPYKELTDRLEKMHQMGQGPRLEDTQKDIAAISRESVEVQKYKLFYNIIQKRKILARQH